MRTRLSDLAIGAAIGLVFGVAFGAKSYGPAATPIPAECVAVEVVGPGVAEVIRCDGAGDPGKPEWVVRVSDDHRKVREYRGRSVTR